MNAFFVLACSLPYFRRAVPLYQHAPFRAFAMPFLCACMLLPVSLPCRSSVSARFLLCSCHAVPLYQHAPFRALAMPLLYACTLPSVSLPCRSFVSACSLLCPYHAVPLCLLFDRTVHGSISNQGKRALLSCSFRAPTMPLPFSFHAPSKLSSCHHSQQKNITAQRS